MPPLHWCACPLYSKTAYVSTVGHRGWSALHTSTSGRNKLIISSRMALDTQRGGRGAWLAESPGGLIYTSRCWARAGCKQISQDRCGNHLVPDKPSRVATTRDTPPRNFVFRVVTDVYPPVCGLNDATCESQRTMPLTYTATQRICFDSHPDSLTTPAPLVLITIITLRTGSPLHLHTARGCALSSSHRCWVQAPPRMTS